MLDVRCVQDDEKDVRGILILELSMLREPCICERLKPRAEPAQLKKVTPKNEFQNA
jgi:hypothetical protein